MPGGPIPGGGPPGPMMGGRPPGTMPGGGPPGPIPGGGPMRAPGGGAKLTVVGLREIPALRHLLQALVQQSSELLSFGAKVC